MEAVWVSTRTRGTVSGAKELDRTFGGCTAEVARLDVKWKFLAKGTNILLSGRKYLLRIYIAIHVNSCETSNKLLRVTRRGYA